MNLYHKNLASGRWFKLSFLEQMANIGSEVERAMKWRYKNEKYFKHSIERALELLYLTIDDEKNRTSYSRLKELTRLYEVLVDYFYFDNIYKSSDELWHKYFYAFTYAVSIGKNKLNPGNR